MEYEINFEKIDFYKKIILRMSIIDFLFNTFLIYFFYYYFIITFFNFFLLFFSHFSYKKINIDFIYVNTFFRIMKNFCNIIYLVFFFANFQYNYIVYIISSLIIIFEISTNYFVFKFNDVLIEIDDKSIEKYINLKKVKQIEFDNV
jgi:hypothetical protein